MSRRHPDLRHRMRALRVRARHRGRVELHGRPLLGPHVRLDVAAGARLVVADGAVIGAMSRLHVHGGTVTIGEGAVLGERCTLVAHTGVTIGQGCVLGDEVVIIDFDHGFADAETPVRLQELVAAPVRVEAGAVLGPRVAVLRGVDVGAGAKVGPHSVVSRSVAAGAVVEGAPARPPGRARRAARAPRGRGRRNRPG